ncbi:unnamed protein product [Prorocentrum cordatum]|uniref:Uncharacterized protein n=1 Tax=Prorocentrum cordatum TaxID=2364126 RepID=A0ABN9SAH1_9DINO|nr:unnamed protein product [Polarella glacialis]
MAGGSSGGGARGGGGSGKSGTSGGPGGGPRSGEPGATGKAAAKSPWYCKSRSTPDASRGFRKLNFGDRMQCKWCNMPKSSHFGGKPAQAAPPRSNAEVKLAQALDDLKKLKAAAAQPDAGGSSAPGGGAPTWREDAAAGGEKRQRLEQLDKQLGEIRRWADMEDDGGDFVEAARSGKAKLEAERDQLRQEVFQAKPKDVQLKSLANHIKELEKQQEKGRGEMVAVAAQQRELDDKAEALRLADAERGAKLAELRAEQARTLGKLAQPPAELRSGMEGEIEVEGLEVSANFLGKMLGSIGVEGALHASLLEPATKRAPIPGEGDPAGGEAMGDEELDVDTQLNFLTKPPPRTDFTFGDSLEGGDQVFVELGRPVCHEGCRGGCCLATANVPSRGPLSEYLLQADGQTTLALAVQEHHCAASALATQQRAAEDAGWQGVWSAATPPPTSKTGTSGGVAVLAPTSIQLTGLPGRDSHALVPGRLAAGHARAGPQEGVMVLSVYLHVGEGLSADNLGIIWQLAQYLGALEAEGYHWVVMGDWNMEAGVLDFGWIRKVRAHIRAPGAPTCRQGSGSKIDYFVLSKSLAGFVAAPPRLDSRGASTWSRWPVHLPLRALRAESRQQVPDEPRAVPREPAKPGCARGPWRWTEVMRCVQAAQDEQGLQIIWDLLLEGIETEILDRRGLVGPARRAFAGRGARREAAGLRLEMAQWGPTKRRKLRGPEAHAWTALAGWASELLSKRDRLGKLLAALGSHMQEEGRKAAAARGKCVKSIAAALAHLKMSLADIEAMEKQRRLVQADEARWKEWVDEAFLGGAGAAHATSKAPALQEMLPALRKEGSAALVDREMKPWIDIWNYHGLTSMELPPDAHTWDKLPPLKTHDVRDVMRSFPWRTGVGQSGIPPRALEDLSDEALHAMVAVYHKCEELLAWPSGRLINTMVRLPKPDGGCRLIGLMPTLVRMWSRAGRPVTRDWGLAHPSALVWGTGPGRSSSDSAYELNLAKEQARLSGLDSAQVALDLWKAYELVAPEAQMVEAPALRFPMRLVWMLLSTYRQPRTLAAFNTTSDLFVAWQGNIAGCGRANSLLMVLALRALQRAHAIAPSVTRRGLVDAATLDWSGPRGVSDNSLSEALKSFSSSMVELKLVMQPQKSGRLASSRLRARLMAPSMRRAGLAEKFWARNLGHELHGPSRPGAAEWPCRRAAGRRAAALVTTGLSPLAGHGAGVAGLADRPLAQLRTVAAATAGVKAGCGTAAVMLLQRRVHYDPIYAATIPLVTRLASRIWEDRGSLASLSASWGKLSEAARAGALSWASVQGPLGATWLALGRIGWSTTAARALQTDLGETLSMLRVAPRDIKDALVEGIQRWQRRRLVAHLPEGQGETLWPRAVRAVACKATPAAELGAIQAVWAGGHFTNAWRCARGYADSDMCQACGGAKDTLMHRRCAHPVLMAPQGEELEQEEPFRKPIAGMRRQLEEAEQKWTIGDRELPLSHGLPLLPATPPPAPSDNVVLEWGAAQEGWPSVVYTDACLVPLLQAGSVQVIVSDLQALVTEGNDWHECQVICSCGVQCAHCGREAYAAKGRALPDCRPCHPTELGRMRARCNQGRPLASSAAVNASLQAAERLEEEELLPASGAHTTAEDQKRALQRKVDYLLEAAKGAPAARPAGTEASGPPSARWSQRPAPRPYRGCEQGGAAGRVGLARPQEGNDLFAIEAWGRAGPLEAALGMLASSWIVDLMGQSLAYASWMKECVEYVCRLLDEEVYRGFFAHNSDEMRGAERLRRAEEFCERGRRDGGPFREAHVDEALQLEGEARQAKLQRLRGYHAAARAFLCDRGSARRAGGRRGPLYFTFFEPAGRAYGDGGWRQSGAAQRRGRSRSRTSGRASQSQGPAGGRAEPQRPALPRPRSDAEGPQRPVDPRAAHAQRRRRSARRSASRPRSPRARGQPAGHAEDGRNGSPDPDAAIGLEVPRSMLRAFAGCWAFDLRDSEAAGGSWMAWAAQCALAWLARPDNEDTRAAAARRAGSIGLRALAQAMARKAWHLKAEVRRITVGHLMSLETLEDWLHVAALQWATLNDVCCTMEGVIGEAGANLPALPGFAGALPGLGRAGSNEQPPRRAGLPRPLGLRGRGIEALRRPWPGTWFNQQLPMARATQGGLRALGSDSDGEDDWPHPEVLLRDCVARPLPRVAAALRWGTEEAKLRLPAGQGVQLAEVHLGHGMRTAGQYAFCCKCGVFAQLKGVDRAKGLKAECGGRLPLGPQATAGEKKKRLYLGRLLSGKDPCTGRPLG